MKRAKPIIVGPRFKRYRLGTFLIEPVNSNGRVTNHGAFTMRGEVRRALQVALGNITEGSPHYGLKLQTGYRSNPRAFDAFSTSVADGQIRFGCTRFSKADSKRLAKWAGVQLNAPAGN